MHSVCSSRRYDLLWLPFQKLNQLVLCHLMLTACLLLSPGWEPLPFYPITNSMPLPLLKRLSHTHTMSHAPHQATLPLYMTLAQMNFGHHGFMRQQLAANVLSQSMNSPSLGYRASLRDRRQLLCDGNSVNATMMYLASNMSMSHWLSRHYDSTDKHGCIANGPENLMRLMHAGDVSLICDWRLGLTQCRVENIQFTFLSMVSIVQALSLLFLFYTEWPSLIMAES